jgi:thiamine-phosphate pyrophosphorylase
MHASRLRGLYAITPDTADSGWLEQRVEQALRGGARALQYRSKLTDVTVRREQAHRLRRMCRTHAALFIVNDDVDLALEVGADGVHLGRDDAPIARARARLPAGAVIGASCYDQLERGEEAVRAGADYLAFGSFFPSKVKPGAVRPSLDLLRDARRRFGVALVAIGGITAENAAAVIEAGADALAVISALFGAPDTLAAARAFSNLFEQSAAVGLETSNNGFAS